MQHFWKEYVKIYLGQRRLVLLLVAALTLACVSSGLHVDGRGLRPSRSIPILVGQRSAGSWHVGTVVGIPYVKSCIKAALARKPHLLGSRTFSKLKLRTSHTHITNHSLPVYNIFMHSPRHTPLWQYFSIIHNFSPLELSSVTSQIPHFFSSLNTSVISFLLNVSPIWLLQEKSH